MKNTLFSSPVGALVSIIGIAVSAFFLAVPANASAAMYAYVDGAGDVRSIDAINWQVAINTAPNIHIHSGVYLLRTASDFESIGDSVNGY